MTSRSVPTPHRYQNQEPNTYRTSDEGRRTPTTVLIYRNGDEYFKGMRVEITKGMFKNWITFLDFLTQHIRLRTGAVHRIYDMEGHEIRGFKEFQHGERYVAATGLLNNQIKYGQKAPVSGQWREFNGEQILPDPPALESEETIQLYLERNGFRPDGDGWDSDFDLKRSWKQSGGHNNHSMEHFHLDKSQPVTRQYANNNVARGNATNYHSQSNARNVAGLGRIPQPMRNQPDKHATVAQQYAMNRQNLVSQLREQWHDESPRRLPNARTTNEINKTANKVVQQQETPEWAKKLSSSIKELAAQVEELRVEGIKVHQDRISMEYNDQQDQQENGENDHEAYDYDYQEDNQSTKSEEDEDENEDEDNSPKSKQNQQSAKSASGSENGHKKKSPTQKPAAATTKTSKSK